MRLTTLLVFLFATVLSGAAEAQTALGLRITARRPSPSGQLTELVLLSETIITAPAADVIGNTLRIAAKVPTCIRAAVLTTASGVSVVVPLDDIMDTTGIEPMKCPGMTASAGPAPVSRPGIAASAIPADAEAMATIRKKCATDWPDDFRMRNYCEEQQLKGLAALRRR